MKTCWGLREIEAWLRSVFHRAEGALEAVEGGVMSCRVSETGEIDGTHFA